MKFKQEGGIIEGMPKNNKGLHLLVEDGNRMGQMGLPGERVPEFYCQYWVATQLISEGKGTCNRPSDDAHTQSKST